MKLEQHIADCGDLIVELNGEFDALGSSKIRQSLEDIAAQAKPDVVFLDLKRVSFIDSSGVGAIVFLYKRLKEKSRNLVISGVHDQPRELLELLRIHKAIPVQLLDGEDPLMDSESCVA